MANDLDEMDRFDEELDGMIDSLQAIEEKKRERTKAIRAFLNDLYDRMDKASQENNADNFRRAIRDGSIFDQEHQDQILWFTKIHARAADLSFKAQGDNRRLFQLSKHWPELMFQEYRERVIEQDNHATAGN